VRAFTLTLGALLAAVVAVNLMGAWSAARDEARVQAVPAALQPGEVVLGYRNVDERRFQRGRLGVIPRPRVVSFGSSRVMQLTGALVGVEPPATFYNLGMSGATVEDYVGLWEILRRQDKIPEMIIFSIDPWVFNADVEQVRWRSLSREIDAFAARREQWAPVELALSGWSRGKELVSYEVLRDSTRRLRRALRGRSAARADAREALVVPEQAVADRQALRADGSLIYDGAFQRRSPFEVQEDAVRWVATNGPGLARLRWNAERLRLLAALWRDMRARGVRVVAYLPPYHPAAWRVIEGDARQREALDQVRAAIAGLAARLDIPFRDFADPASIPCAADEFFDGQHARPSCLQKLLRLLPTGER
jgi:hypothetical protein